MYIRNHSYDLLEEYFRLIAKLKMTKYVILKFYFTWKYYIIFYNDRFDISSFVSLLVFKMRAYYSVELCIFDTCLIVTAIQ